MNVRFSSRCSFGHATLMNSTIRLAGIIGEPIGFHQRDDAVVVGRERSVYWLGSKPWLPLWA